jgi:hypothetical protein
MRPHAVEITGEIIGQGQPGVFWSPDLVLKDETGLMFLLYRSSIPFGRLFFALHNVDRIMGEKVTVKGWYRRGLKPYIEMAKIEAMIATYKGGDTISLFGPTNSQATEEIEHFVSRSYSRWIQTAAAALCTAIGLVWLWSTL